MGVRSQPKRQATSASSSKTNTQPCLTGRPAFANASLTSRPVCRPTSAAASTLRTTTPPLRTASAVLLTASSPTASSPAAPALLVVRSGRSTTSRAASWATSWPCGAVAAAPSPSSRGSSSTRVSASTPASKLNLVSSCSSASVPAGDRHNEQPTTPNNVTLLLPSPFPVLHIKNIYYFLF